MIKRIPAISITALGLAAALVSSAVAQVVTGTPEANRLSGRTGTFYVNPVPDTTPPDNVNNGNSESIGVAIAASGNVIIGWEDDGGDLLDLEAVWTLYDPVGNSITPNVDITSQDPSYAGQTVNSKFMSYFRADGSPISGRTAWGPKIKANPFGSGIGMGATTFDLGLESAEFAAYNDTGDYPSVQLLTDSGAPVKAVAGVTTEYSADFNSANIRIADWDYLSNGNIVIVGESRQKDDLVEKYGGAAPFNHAIYRIIDPAGNEVKAEALVSESPEGESSMWHGVGVTANGFGVRFSFGGKTTVRLFNNAGAPITGNIDVAALTGKVVPAQGGRGDGVGFHGNGVDAYVISAAGTDETGALRVWVTVLDTAGKVKYSKAVSDDITATAISRLDAAINANGRVLAVWGAKTADNPDFHAIMGRVLDAAGKPLGGTFFVSESAEETAPIANSYNPRVAARGDSFAVIWVSGNKSTDPSTGEPVDVVAGRLFGVTFEPGSIESVGLSRIVPDTPLIVPEADALGNWEPYTSVLGNSTFLIEGNTFAVDSTAEQRFVVAFQPAAGGAMKLGDAFFSDAGQPYRGPINASRQNGNPGRVAGDKRPGAVNFMAGAEASPHVHPELFNSDGRFDLGFDRFGDGRYGTVQTYRLDPATLAQTPLSKAQDSANGRLTSGTPAGNQITRFGGEIACLDNGNFVSVVEDRSRVRRADGNCGVATIFAPDGSIVTDSFKVADGDLWSNVAAYRGGFAVRMNGIIFFYDNAGTLKGQIDQATSGRTFDRGRGDGTRIAAHINKAYVFLVGTTGAGLVSVAVFDSRDASFVAVADVSEPGFVASADRVGLAVDALSRVVVSWVSKPTDYEFEQVVARVLALDATNKTISPLTHTFFAFINTAKAGIRTLQMNPSMTTRQILIAAKGEINLQNKPDLGVNSTREVNLYTVFTHPAPADDPTTPVGGGASISIARSGSDAVVTFTGTLQAADNVNGPYSDVAGATSPRTIPLGANAKKFWRAKQ
jgi:hypothetical protein